MPTSTIGTGPKLSIFEVCEISEGILAWIKWIVEDGCPLPYVEFFFPWTLPPAVGPTIYGKAVSVLVVIRRFVSSDCAVYGLFPFGDRPVHVPFVDRQDCAQRPR